MPLIRRGSNFSFLAALYCSFIGFQGLRALPTKEEGIKALNPKREQYSAAKNKIIALILMCGINVQRINQVAHML